MTPQTFLAIDFNEIPSIQIKCGCEAFLSIPIPKDGLANNLQCPGCNQAFWHTSQDKIYIAVLGIMNSLSHWKRLDHQAFHLGFTLPTPSRQPQPSTES